MDRKRNPIPTRRSLLSRLKNWDDEKSWQQFFDTYWKLIYGVARKAGLSDAEAQDVVQDVVINVSRKISDLKYDPALGSFKGWLLTTTRWRIHDQYRKRMPAAGRRPRGQDDDRRTGTIERIPDPASLDLDAVWNEEWEKNIVDAALARTKKKVSPRQYQIFDCYVIKEWPAAKVAETLGVNVGQVYLAKHRVGPIVKRELARLRRELI